MKPALLVDSKGFAKWVYVPFPVPRTYEIAVMKTRPALCKLEWRADDSSAVVAYESMKFRLYKQHEHYVEYREG